MRVVLMIVIGLLVALAAPQAQTSADPCVGRTDDGAPPPPPPPPPPASVQCEIRVVSTPYADGDARFIIRCDTNGRTPATLRQGYVFPVPVAP
jgi:hypothetical protein